MWWIHTYWWLENNNLWKASVAWGVGLVLNAAWAIRVWARQQRLNREKHEAVMDALDVNTPGGLGDIKKIIKQEQDDTDPDDNGTDQNDNERRNIHGPGHSPGHSSLLDNIHVPKGGSGAGHR